MDADFGLSVFVGASGLGVVFGDYIKPGGFWLGLVICWDWCNIPFRGLNLCFDV